MAENRKETNPKDLVGIRKVPISGVPIYPILEAGLAMLEGARKYGRHNYRTTGVAASVYYDAAIRHLTEWWEGQDIDKASGIHNLAKAIGCLVVVRDSELRGNWVDDRPPAMEAGWLDVLNAQAGEIIDRYPDPKPPHTQKELK